MRAATPNVFDPARAAARLTKAQRRAVLRGGISDERSETIHVLLREHLFYLEPTIGTTCWSLELTNFGEAVQEQLRRKAAA